MRIDAHQHFWRFDEAALSWIQPGWPIRRDFLPTDLMPLLDAHDLSGSIAVQASQAVTETEWLLELADSEPRLLGVVGWVDLASDRVKSDLDRIAHQKLVGIRHIVQDEPDGFLLRPDFVRGVERLAPRGLVYDVLVFPRQLPAAVELTTRLPNQVFVLDHIAKPPIASGEISPWRERIVELARRDNVYCKVSGMVTEASWRSWRPEEMDPYLDVVLEAFGPQRLMYGSDWPVCLLAAEYPRVHALAKRFCARLSESERERLFGGTAAQCYGLWPEPPEPSQKRYPTP